MNYDEAVGRLAALGDAPDPDLLDRTAEPLEQAMRTDDPQGYAWFVIAVCGQLNSRDLGDWRRQDELERKYARLGLRHATVLPPAAELRLLEHVWAVPTDDRREFARRWLAVLGRLEREIDPKFDPADVPLLNVPVPDSDLPPAWPRNTCRLRPCGNAMPKPLPRTARTPSSTRGRLRCAGCCPGISRLRSGSWWRPMRGTPTVRKS